MQALYRWFNTEGDLLYVGISVSLWKRAKEHEKHSDWFSDISFCTVEWFTTRRDVENAENTALMTENPRHNKTANKNASKPNLKLVPPNSRDTNREKYLEEQNNFLRNLLARDELYRNHQSEITHKLYKKLLERMESNA